LPHIEAQAQDRGVADFGSALIHSHGDAPVKSWHGIDMTGHAGAELADHLIKTPNFWAHA
jgi:hypothetical protein